MFSLQLPTCLQWWAPQVSLCLSQWLFCTCTTDPPSLCQWVLPDYFAWGKIGELVLFLDIVKKTSSIQSPFLREKEKFLNNRDLCLEYSTARLRTRKNDGSLLIPETLPGKTLHHSNAKTAITMMHTQTQWTSTMIRSLKAMVWERRPTPRGKLCRVTTQPKWSSSGGRWCPDWISFSSSYFWLFSAAWQSFSFIRTILQQRQRMGNVGCEILWEW